MLAAELGALPELKKYMKRLMPFVAMIKVGRLLTPELLSAIIQSRGNSCSNNSYNSYNSYSSSMMLKFRHHCICCSDY